jgi:hypothetical protein
MRTGLASMLAIVITGAIAWPRRITATAATMSTLPPPAASVLTAQLTKPATNNATSMRPGGPLIVAARACLQQSRQSKDDPQ